MALADSSACLDKFLADRSPSPSEQFQKEEFQLRLAEAIERLPPRQRHVFIGRKLLGKSMRDLGADMKLTREAVNGLLNRAQRKLCQLMAPFEDR